jgi:uncharacterized protein (TIGR02145 family)
MISRIYIFPILMACFVLMLTNSCNKEVESLSTIVTDIDGNIYNTVKIGEYVWMVEDLRVTKYRNGDPIPLFKFTSGTEMNNLTTGAYLNNYNDKPGSNIIYGKFYNWYAINDDRKIAPTGWHVPTYAEWLTLISYLGGENVAGGKLKEADTTHWASPNTGATNIAGFTALPNGNFFNSSRLSGQWWSTTEYNATYVYNLEIDYNSTGSYIRPMQKKYGYVVRCIKDYSIFSVK